ncbi:MAG: DUF2442 domain-containing protein [Rhizobiales bacterium]|nr:DUF2442 domain-containing protein [Hyphomicrobiales bacterium]
MNGNVSILEADDDEIISAGAPLPRLASVMPLDGRKLRVQFEDGREKTVDLASALESRRFYKPLRDNDDLFRAFRISEYRDSIEWNDDLDFSAVWLEALPEAEFSNEEFRAAMDRMGMTLDGMAEALEVSRRLIADYRKDKHIPRHISLATRYLIEHAPRP